MNKPLAVLSIFFGVSCLCGLPEGTTGGVSTTSTDGKVMTITAPDGSIFNHTRFNVGSDESVRFVQPGVNARVLNRISSNSPSRIDGRVEANGKLYFAAPGGLIFGEGSVIQARHLQAMGGDIFDSDFIENRDRYPSLSGSVKNEGLIEADRIVLGGKSVTNSGTVNARSGSILIATGEGVEISNADGSFAVEITEGINASGSMAGDMAGNALLQSGILNASSVELTGSSITQSGKINASEVKFSEFTEISGDNGVVNSSNVELQTKANRFSNVSLSGKANAISTVHLGGSFNEIKVRSAHSLSVKHAEAGLSEVIAQHADFRVDDGDLDIKVSFSPVFTSSSSSLLLGAKDGSVDTAVFDFISDFDQVVIFGNNVDTEIAAGLNTQADDLFVLNAISLEFDSLSVGLDAATIFKLEDENPGFNLSGSNQISDNVSSNQSDGNSLPDGDLAGIPGPSLGGSSNQNVAVPDGVPSLSDVVSQQVGDGRLSEEQLTAAMYLGLYSEYSYLLQSIPEDEVKLIEFGESGGSSTLLGGDYASMSPVAVSNERALPEVSIGSDKGWDTYSSADMTSDDKGESEEKNLIDEGLVSDDQPKDPIPTVRVVGTKPLAPVTRPVFSPQASQMLEQALTPAIKETLKGFSNR